VNRDLPSQEEAGRLRQGNQRKERNSERGKRFHVISPPTGTWGASELADRNRYGSSELSGNDAPILMGDTLRRIKAGGNVAWTMDSRALNCNQGGRL